MKKIILMLTVVATVISCKENKKKEVALNTAVPVEKAAITDNVDVANSVLNWEGSKPTGTHHGTVQLKSGNLVLENGIISSGEFIIDMASIKDAERNARLEKHLKSSDFFDIASYPTSKFVITSVENKDGKLAVTGNLTIKATTKSITIPAMVSEEEGTLVFKSDTFEVDRSKFDVRYGSKSFFDNLKNKFINDMMKFSFVVKTVKN